MKLFGRKMKKSTWIWIVTILLCVSLLLISYLIVKAQTLELRISWQHYAEYGSPDAEFIKIYELTSDTIIVRFIGQTSVSNDSLIFSISKEDRIYYFGATAIDSNKNESLIFKEVAIWDNETSILPRQIKIKRID